MRIQKPLLALRLATLAGLAASAALTAEHLHPARKFCPLEAACERARTSALGTIAGVPTSVIGLAAFSALLLATLLPKRLARKVARPAAWIGSALALVFIGYQVIALGSLCPLCMVADASAVAAGVAAFAWRRRRTRRIERLSTRLRWAGAAALIVAIPMLWPVPSEPGWERIARASDPRAGGDAPASPDEVVVVEYLNPFCAHCRATKEAFDRALASLSEEERARIRTRRVYVWSSRDVPFWAKGCACAKPQQKEPAFFAELLRARSDRDDEVRAAAQRAGLDLAWWERCVGEAETLVPLHAMHERVLAANLKGLPVIDVGERRLLGEQTTPELWEALRAALAR
jgi:uncharacterized membrane protein